MFSRVAVALAGISSTRSILTPPPDTVSWLVGIRNVSNHPQTPEGHGTASQHWLRVEPTTSSPKGCQPQGSVGFQGHTERSGVVTWWRGPGDSVMQWCWGQGRWWVLMISAWNLFVLYFGVWTLQKKAFSNQNRGHLGSRCFLSLLCNYWNCFFCFLSKLCLEIDFFGGL